MSGAEQILSAEREHGLGIRLLNHGERDRVREVVRSFYGRSQNRLWEHLHGCASIQDSEAWRWIGEFVGQESCVLLFDASEETEMFHIPTGPALHELLSQTSGFDFYVTDRRGTYPVCYNDHDVLVCCGSAKEWLEAQRFGR